MEPSEREKQLARALYATLARYSAKLAQVVRDYVNLGTAPAGLTAAESAVVAQALPLLDALIDNRAVRIIGKFGDAQPIGLAQLKSERRNAWKRMVRGAKQHVLDVVDRIPVTPALESEWKLARVARRRSDKFRKAALDVLMDTVKEGDAVARGRSALIKKLTEYGDAGRITIPVNRKTPLSNPFRTYDVRDYSEMVSMTTTREAEVKSNLIEAERIGTSLVKMPAFGRNYAAEGDEICARINGRIFSIKPSGSAGASGKIYPYLYGTTDPGGLGYTGIGDTGYLMPHPRCRHVAVPIAEEVA